MSSRPSKRSAEGIAGIWLVLRAAQPASQEEASNRHDDRRAPPHLMHTLGHILAIGMPRGEGKARPADSAAKWPGINEM